MTTRKTENGITVIAPARGMRLTDGETIAEGEVWLSRLDGPGEWREVTEAEAERMEAERMAEGLI